MRDIEASSMTEKSPVIIDDRGDRTALYRLGEPTCSEATLKVQDHV
jgi:hypothetical protein